jgi:hypothetical protein
MEMTDPTTFGGIMIFVGVALTVLGLVTRRVRAFGFVHARTGAPGHYWFFIGLFVTLAAGGALVLKLSS